MDKKIIYWKNKRPKTRLGQLLFTSTFGLLVASCVVSACSDDKREEPKVDHPTELIFDQSALPSWASISWNTWTVERWISDDKIAEAVKSAAKAKDKDGGAGIKEISVHKEEIIVTVYGTNGKNWGAKEDCIRLTLMRSDIKFPNALPGSDNNTIDAGDQNFFKNLFRKTYEIGNKKIKAEKILVNGLEIDKNHIINRPEKYTIQLVFNLNGEEIIKEYILVVKALDVKVNNLSWYTTQVEKKFDVGESQLDWGQINAVAKTMKMWAFLGLVNKVLYPSGKQVAVAENREFDHIFEFFITQIIQGNNEIVYEKLGKDMPTWEDDPNFEKELQDILGKYDFVLAEDNNSNNEEALLMNINVSPYAYLFTGEWSNMEYLSVEGKSVVNFPGIVGKDGEIYTSPDISYNNPEYDPLHNDINSLILVGPDFWSTSGTTVWNEAVWSVIVDLWHRLWKKIDKEILNGIIKNHPEILKEVKYSYYPKWVKHISKNIVYTNEVVAYYIDLENLIVLLSGMFDLNPDLERLEELWEVPLFKYYDKLNYEYITLWKENGIVWKEVEWKKIPYVSMQMLVQQDLTLADVRYDLVAAPNDWKGTYYVKREGWNISSWTRSVGK